MLTPFHPPMAVSLDTEAQSPFVCRDSSAIFQDQMDGFIWTFGVPLVMESEAQVRVEPPIMPSEVEVAADEEVAA